MKELELQLDGGQLEGHYNRYNVQLVTEDGRVYLLASIYATASSMGATPPYIEGAPMAPDTEYWVVSNSAMLVLSAATQLTIVYVGLSDAPIFFSISEWTAYTATEEAGWTGIEAITFPTAAATFGADTGTVRGVGFETDTHGDVPVLQRVGWCQTGQSNLTPVDLRDVTLRADGPGTQPGEYAAVSRLVPLQT